MTLARDAKRCAFRTLIYANDEQIVMECAGRKWALCRDILVKKRDGGMSSVTRSIICHSKWILWNTVVITPLSSRQKLGKLLILSDNRT